MKRLTSSYCFRFEQGRIADLVEKALLVVEPAYHPENKEKLTALRIILPCQRTIATEVWLDEDERRSIAAALLEAGDTSRLVLEQDRRG